MELLIYSGGAAALGVYFFFKGWHWKREVQIIRNTPTSKIRSLAMGRVEIYGDVIPIQMVKSPFSNQDCVYCRWTVEEYVRTKNSGHWRTIKRGTVSREFYVKDDTGQVLVNPDGAEIDIPYTYQYGNQFGSGIPQAAQQFLESQKIRRRGLLFNRTLRLREYFLSPEDKVYILGTCGDNPNVQDGTSTTNTGDLMIQKGKSAWYYISDRSEKEILKKFIWKVRGGLFGGSALILGGLAGAFAYLGIL
ncbi:MAG: GIDE domain-containing protein [Nanobdellota archaeon]